MDIRNFFSANGASKSTNSKLSRKKKDQDRDEAPKKESKNSPPAKRARVAETSHIPVVEEPKKSNKKDSKPLKEEKSMKKEKSLSPPPKKLSKNDNGQVKKSIKTELPQPCEPSLLLVEKYKPTTVKAIIGQQGDRSNVKKLITWIQNWSKYQSGAAKPPPRPPPWGSSNDNGGWAKAVLLSGPPGVGKTTSAYLVSKELGYDVMELNASDTRSKKLLEQTITDAISSTSLGKASKKRILLMDEVDGMAGNEDRGGMAELIQLIKKSKIPVICMCNDRNHQKIRSLANYCFDLRFHRPRAEQIKGAMMSVCFKEKIKIAPEALMELIIGCNQDIRQVLHHLSVIKARHSDSKYDQNEAKSDAEKSKKTSIKIGPFDVVRQVFSASAHKDMTLFDKSDLFFQDYSLGPLFAHESYLTVEPEAAKNKKQVLELISKAADSFCQGDLIETTIRSKNGWSLLPVQAMFSSVIPGEYMSGRMHGQIQFPAWLGKRSKQTKFDRMLQEVQCHTRLRSGLSKNSVNLEFAQVLRDSIVRPLADKGSDGVKESVEVMKCYSLLREDLDNLLEVCQWPHNDPPMKNVETKVKTAFTRLYNKEIVLPYSTGNLTAKKRGAATKVEDLLEDEENQDDEDEDEDKDDISKDSMIKAKKPSAASTSKASKASTAKGKGGAGKRSKKK